MTSKIRKYVASAEAIYDIALGCIEENSNELHIRGRFFSHCCKTKWRRPR